MNLFESVNLIVFILNVSVVLGNALITKPSIDVYPGKRINYNVSKIETKRVSNVEFNRKSDTLKLVNDKFYFSILFPCGDSTLTNDMKKILTKYSIILNKNSSTKISVVGHTDNISSLKINQKLSESRARVVANFLIKKNIDSSHIDEIKGKSYEEPLADNFTEAGRSANRRVEVSIVSTNNLKDSSKSTHHTKDSLKVKTLPASLKNIIEKVINHPVKSNDVEIEINGLLVDETKTRAGREFYDLFYAGWEAPDDVKNYTITIIEKPFRLTSTLIIISMNDEILYQEILQPRQDLIEEQSQVAISTAQNYLENFEEITKQLNGEDQAGSGIY